MTNTSNSGSLQTVVDDDGAHSAFDSPLFTGSSLNETFRSHPINVSFGDALGEWRRQNAIRIEEKERNEKELLSQILTEADDYKVEFYNKRQINCGVNKSTNMEKEKLFLVNQEKFHGEADKNYWKTIADLIPNEMPTAMEKKRVKKNEQENKPAIVVVQGPKPGKPTDLARMRQILLKLKHNTPPHLKNSPQMANPGQDVESVVVA